MTPAGFAATNPDLTGRSVLVIGLGRSGRAAARLAASRSARVTCADSREQLPREALDLENEGIRVLAGGNEFACDGQLILVQYSLEMCEHV